MGNASASVMTEWRHGWRLVLAATCGFSFFSVMTASMGVFMEPLGAEFGWGRTLLSSGVMIASITTAVLSPFFGTLVDRYGARRVAMPGLLATMLAVAGFALANGSPLQWLLLWCFYAVISISVKTTVWTVAVALSFTASRGLALGVTLSGTALAQSILPVLSNWLIDGVGWRWAYVCLACGWGGGTLVLCHLFFHDRGRSDAPAPTAGEASGEGLSVGEALRNPALWRIAVSTFVIMLLTVGLSIHQVSILVETGMSRTTAAWLASLAGAFGIIGKLVSGILLDRFQANWIGGITLAVTALAFALLVDGIQSPALIVIAMIVNGYSAGSKLQIASYLTVKYAGMKQFGVIFGLLVSVISVGSGLGPVIAGLIYDWSGGYSPFLLAGAAGSLLAGALLLTLPPYPEWRKA